MASYTIANGDRAAHAKALTASTVDTVSFAADSSRGGNRDLVEIVVHESTEAVYFSLDGSTPTVAGAKTYMLLSGSGLLLDPPDGQTVVKLISSGTATYSVVAP